MFRPLRLIAVVGSAVLGSVLPGSIHAVTINPGDLLIADTQAGVDQHGAVIRVDPHTGAQTLVSSGGQGRTVCSEDLLLAVQLTRSPDPARSRG